MAHRKVSQKVKDFTKDFTTSIFGSPAAPTPSTPVNSARGPPRPYFKITTQGIGWKAFMQGLGVLKEVSVVFPPLQAAAGGLLRVLEQIGQITDARDDLGVMAQRIAALATLIRRYEGRTDDEDIRNRLEGMTAVMEEQTRRIEKKIAPGVRNIIDSPDARYIIECTRVVSFLITIFEVDTALNTEAKTSEIHKYILEKLSLPVGSAYNESGGTGTASTLHGSGECMPGTRVGILTELMAWATDPESPPIYLLTGMAGAGKSAIARSFARLLDREMLLGASFFCSRKSEDRSNPLARAMVDGMKRHPGVMFTLRPVDFQFAALLLHPSQAMPDQTATNAATLLYGSPAGGFIFGGVSAGGSLGAALGAPRCGSATRHAHRSGIFNASCAGSHSGSTSHSYSLPLSIPLLLIIHPPIISSLSPGACLPEDSNITRETRRSADQDLT
ncbi:hypothetical protein B0H10DRAFT_1954799 [Mycena sp. CBHHK59/15]|nr:hypothetical protein B0H10DRAFT_1954799 [Mycena sp. CBHHK59/15]